MRKLLVLALMLILAAPVNAGILYSYRPTSSTSEVVDDTTPQLGGDLDVNGNKIVSTSNGNIDIEPNGTGNVLLGNLTIDADQTVGAGQDNYVMTYDNGTGLVSLEAAAGGGAPSDATYITQTSNGTLSAEQALADLSTGVVTVTATTGTLNSVVPGSSGNVLTSNGTIWTSAAPAGGSPGGSDTYIQYNDGGSSFGGDAGLTYTVTTQTVNMGSLIINEAGLATSDVRMESDTETHLFFLDSSSNSIGFADSTPTEGKYVFKDSANAASMYVQNTSQNTSGVAGQFWLGNGGGTSNVNAKLGLYANTPVGNVWAGGQFSAGDNGGTASLYAYNAGPSGDAFDFPLVVQGGTTWFYDTDIVFYNGAGVYIMYLDESGNTVTFGSNTDLGGLVNIDGRADEPELWVQAHSTQTSSVALFEKSDGTDIFTLSNTGDLVSTLTTSTVRANTVGTTGAFAGVSSNVGSIMLRDTDDAGWTECTALNGTLSCGTDTDGVPDGTA